MHNPELHRIFVDDVLAEVERQEEKWGVQTHPAGCGTAEYRLLEEQHRKQTDEAADRGLLTWADILLEEVYEALGASTPAAVVEELVQVAAVASSFARFVRENGV